MSPGMIPQFKLQTPNSKHQTANTKHQAPNTKEDPNSKPQTEHDPARGKHAKAEPHLSLGFGFWNFFGVCCLVFGVSHPTVSCALQKPTRERSFGTPMKRIPEPELMDTEEQARAYAAADFSEAHQSYVTLFNQTFPKRPARAAVLDLGCGPADVTLRFAKANPGYAFHAVDGSAAMLSFARQALQSQRALAKRVRLIEGYIPGAPIPRKKYDVILSSNFLHHLHDPMVLWRCVRRYAKTGTRVFVTDLFRPTHRAKAKALVRKYSGGEAPILKRDFYHSLLAAFTPSEIEDQLEEAGLEPLLVRVVSDRHLMIFGEIP